MTISRRKCDYKCIVFLKDEQDKSLLRLGTYLYGQFVKPTKTFLSTPYSPPSENFPVIGVVENRPRYDYNKPGLLVLSAQNQGLIAHTVIDNHSFELTVEIIFKVAAYARTPFSPSEMKLLQNKTVTIIGCGTGGCKIAVELTRGGVGHFKLCDPDMMEFANISRHEGDLFDVGKPKTQVVAERIYRINPAAQVETYFEDIFNRPLDEIKNILNSNLVAAATDKTSIQLLINELTHRFGIACVFGGCYEEARGGEVFFALPGEKMPCLACLRAGLKQPEINAEIDYSTATGPEYYEGEPGLHAAIDFVTCVEVQICLAILLREAPVSKLAKLIDPRFNFILIGGALGAGFYRFKKPFDVFFQPLKGPRKNCPVCQNNNGTLTEINGVCGGNVAGNIEIVEET